MFALGKELAGRGWVKRKADAGDAGAEATALDLLGRAEAVRVRHPAQDVGDGGLWYGLPVGDALVVITSARQAHRADQLPGGIALRHADPGPSAVSRDAAVRWFTAGAPGSIARTLDELAAFFPRSVVLQDRRTARWIAAWTLATWCSRAFRVFPDVSIGSWAAPVDGGPLRAYYPLDGLIGSESIASRVVHSTGAVSFLLLTRERNRSCFFTPMAASRGQARSSDADCMIDFVPLPPPVDMRDMPRRSEATR
ncbi:MAG: hypothetical protein HYU51_20015 [Candidatus Rokubacteria bacterium]|nr:hypothetical protein [Candidatus Rokubacteria bacterium]